MSTTMNQHNDFTRSLAPPVFTPITVSKNGKSWDPEHYVILEPAISSDFRKYNESTLQNEIQECFDEELPKYDMMFWDIEGNKQVFVLKNDRRTAIILDRKEKFKVNAAKRFDYRQETESIGELFNTTGTGRRDLNPEMTDMVNSRIEQSKSKNTYVGNDFLFSHRIVPGLESIFSLSRITTSSASGRIDKPFEEKKIKEKIITTSDEIISPTPVKATLKSPPRSIIEDLPKPILEEVPKPIFEKLPQKEIIEESISADFPRREEPKLISKRVYLAPITSYSTGRYHVDTRDGKFWITQKTLSYFLETIPTKDAVTKLWGVVRNELSTLNIKDRRLDENISKYQMEFDNAKKEKKFYKMKELQSRIDDAYKNRDKFRPRNIIEKENLNIECDALREMKDKIDDWNLFLTNVPKALTIASPDTDFKCVFCVRKGVYPDGKRATTSDVLAILPTTNLMQMLDPDNFEAASLMQKSKGNDSRPTSLKIENLGPIDELFPALTATPISSGSTPSPWTSGKNVREMVSKPGTPNSSYSPSPTHRRLTPSRSTPKKKYYDDEENEYEDRCDDYSDEEERGYYRSR